MDEKKLRELLMSVRDKQMGIEDALAALQKLPFVDMDFAMVDSHRSLVKGFPEVVYCEGKRTEHIVAILKELTSGSGPVLATRANQEVYAAVKAAIPDARYHDLSRSIVYEPEPLPLPERLPWLIYVLLAAAVAILALLIVNLARASIQIADLRESTA